MGGDPNKSQEQGAESQQIVATRPLYCLQYSVLSKSSAKDLPQRAYGIVKLGAAFGRVTLDGEPTGMLKRAKHVFLGR